MLFSRAKTRMVTADQALPGRAEYAYAVPDRHVVLGTRTLPPYPEELEQAVFGLGCFWGAERLFWSAPGVWTTAVGYSGGLTPYPTYDEVCSGLTGHAEVVLAVYDPAQISYAELLTVFFEGHDPTQGMRQGHDVGTQYRSAIYYASQAQQIQAAAAKAAYSQQLAARRLPAATSQVSAAGTFYFAEGQHQQYLAKNPMGYCGLGGTGVSCPVGLFADVAE